MGHCQALCGRTHREGWQILPRMSSLWQDRLGATQRPNGFQEPQHNRTMVMVRVPEAVPSLAVGSAPLASEESLTSQFACPAGTASQRKHWGKGWGSKLVSWGKP